MRTVPYPTAWVNEGVIYEMASEADRAAPNETGGMILGWENEHRNEVVVLAVTGAGPNATHTPTSFHPDGAWQQQQLDAAYGHSNGIVTYLGDWHVHPAGGFGMSRRDRRTMARTAVHGDARCPRPLMALLARSPDRYLFGVWVWEASWLHPVIGRAISLRTRTFVPTDDETRLLNNGCG